MFADRLEEQGAKVVEADDTLQHTGGRWFAVFPTVDKAEAALNSHHAILKVALLVLVFLFLQHSFPLTHPIPCVCTQEHIQAERLKASSSQQLETDAPAAEEKTDAASETATTTSSTSTTTLPRPPPYHLSPILLTQLHFQLSPAAKRLISAIVPIPDLPTPPAPSPSTATPTAGAAVAAVPASAPGAPPPFYPPPAAAQFYYAGSAAPLPPPPYASGPRK